MTHQEQMLQNLKTQLLAAYGQASAFNLILDDLPLEMRDPVKRTIESLQSSIRYAIGAVKHLKVDTRD